MMHKRTMGVLMPLFSMRRSGDAGIGDLLALEQWVDWAAAHRVGFLQILPVNALGRDDVPSPYSAISSVALEPLYLSPERVPGMPEQRDLYPEEAPPLQRPGGRDWVDYARVRQYKDYWLRRAWERFEREAAFAPLRAVCAAWCAEQGSWLEDFAAFVVASTAFGTVAWWHWPEQNPDVIRHYAHATAVADAAFRYTCWLQWLCAREWAMVRAHADAAGVQLMGDVPIGVSAASADVFFERHLFDLSWSGGAPAEGNFAEDPFTAKWGQNWGIPLYRWEIMAQDGYAWWGRRVRKLGEIVRMCRVDHILGFYRIYAFPWMPERNAEFLDLSPDEAAARCGGRRPGFRPRPDWEPADRRANLEQGDRLLRQLQAAAPELQLIGEDLGCVPDYVRPDLSALRIAGYKIPHWEIDERQRIVPGSSYNPCSFATYATHDFPPLCNDWNDWYMAVAHARDVAYDETLSPDEIRDALLAGRDCGRVLAWLGDFAGLTREQSLVPWSSVIKEALLRALCASRSDYAALMWTELFDVPVRLNTPGTCGGANWRARMPFTAAEAAALPQSALLERLIRESKRG